MRRNKTSVKLIAILMALVMMVSIVTPSVLADVFGGGA